MGASYAADDDECGTKPIVDELSPSRGDEPQVAWNGEK
jgi:hypothetical protein